MLQVIHQKSAAFVLFALVSLCTSAKAASLCVSVSDPANLPLPEASLNAVNLGMNKRFTGRTDRAGKACLSALPEGLYSVEVGLPGFLNVRYYPVRIAPVATHELRFQLPFGEITEGGLAQEATLSGTLKQDDVPVQSAKICIFENGSESAVPVACDVTNDLGEYAIVVPTGFYTVELRLPHGAIQRSKVDLSVSGFHRNLLTVTRQ
jgi:hypothetical protein